VTPIHADGTIAVPVTVPNLAAGDHYMYAQCQDGGQWVRTVFTVTP
jgi:hypothetical protein